MSNYGVRDPNQILTDFNAAMSRYNALLGGQGNGYQMIPQTPTDTRRGEFCSVSGFEEVRDAPARMDGSPTMYVCFRDKVFWVKKYLNGTYQIQKYKFSCDDSPDDIPEISEEIPEQTEDLKSQIATLTEKVDMILSKIGGEGHESE